MSEPIVDPVEWIVGVANGAELARSVFGATLDDPDRQAEYEAEVAELLAEWRERDQDGGVP